MEKTSVVRQIAVAAPIDVCWRYLTEPDLIAKWFADVIGDFRVNCCHEFHFGDGDFFACGTSAMEAPTHLAMWWRFMNAGWTSEIDFQLAETPAVTDVTVTDCGNYSTRAAQELSEGWDDFLGRLDRAVRTGENSRYRWSEVIGTGAAVAAPPEAVRQFFAPPDLFPDSLVHVEEREGNLALEFENDAWSGHRTQASVRITTGDRGTSISVSHGGWLELPEEIRISERKRIAGQWATVVGRLESTLGYAEQHCRHAETI